jgi:hypothetical protein
MAAAAAAAAAATIILSYSANILASWGKKFQDPKWTSAAEVLETDAFAAAAVVAFDECYSSEAKDPVIFFLWLKLAVGAMVVAAALVTALEVVYQVGEKDDFFAELVAAVVGNDSVVMNA